MLVIFTCVRYLEMVHLVFYLQENCSPLRRSHLISSDVPFLYFGDPALFLPWISPLVLGHSDTVYTRTRYWLIAGPASQTVVQHWASIGSVHHAYSGSKDSDYTRRLLRHIDLIVMYNPRSWNWFHPQIDPTDWPHTKSWDISLDNHM